MHPADLLLFTDDVGVVVRIGSVGVRPDREHVFARGVGDGVDLTCVPESISIQVNEDFPVGQAHFVVFGARRVVGTVGVALAIAVDIVELSPADLARNDGRRCQLDRRGTAATNVHCGLQGATCPRVGAIGHAFALVGHITGGGNQQTVLDFGTARGGVGAGVDK